MRYSNTSFLLGLMLLGLVSDFARAEVFVLASGGRVVGEGRPAKIAATPGSYTGQFLMRYYSSSDGRLVKAQFDEDVLSVATGSESGEGIPQSQPAESGIPAIRTSKAKRSVQRKASKGAAPWKKKTGRP